MVNKRVLLHRYKRERRIINKKLNSAKKATRNKKKFIQKDIRRRATDMSYWVRGKKA